MQSIVASDIFEQCIRFLIELAVQLFFYLIYSALIYILLVSSINDVLILSLWMTKENCYANLAEPFIKVNIEVRDIRAKFALLLSV